jgi:3-deoxy-D-manno-octulosonic-acid transferase
VSSPEPARASPAYRVLARVAVRVLPAAASLSTKLARGDRERRAAVARWEAWGKAERDPSRPLVWCHAASAGEGLQAEPVLRLLRERQPGWQVAASFFSPSAESSAPDLPADVVDYLPYDTAPAVRAVLDAVRPTAIVFTAADLWPELATAAAARGIRVGMIAATVGPESGRLRWPARGLARAGYAALDLVGAVTERDAQRMASLGTPGGRISVTGDPRFDSASHRADSGADSPVPPLADRPTLVAGSTGPADESVVTAAFSTVRREHPRVRLILVPHEPTPRRLGGIERLVARAGLVARRLGDSDDTASIVLVDRVGVLASLYRGAWAAYVGGGFGRRGLHSVLEPAACGVPVVFGPRWRSSHAAGLLLDAGGGAALPARDAGPALARIWAAWLRNPAERARRAGAARQVVEGGRGGAARNAALIERLVDLSGRL